jgi:hypothetical protein
MHPGSSRDRSPSRGADLGKACSLAALTGREQSMTVTITRVQRDAVYELVIARLTGIGDLWLSVKRREFADAKRMGREFARGSAVAGRSRLG